MNSTSWSDARQARTCPDTNDESLPVIALVASAGGLSAVSAVIAELPAEFFAAVIVLIHQAPDRENALVSILGRRTTLPVEAGQDDVLLRPGIVVVAPPGKHVLIAPGPRVALVASGAAPPSRPSADLLLATLAMTCGPSATAVVLSGGGHDAATGASAVQRFVGTVIASDELSFEVFSMPRAAIERDAATVQIAAVSDIAALLTALVARPQL